MKSLYSIKPLLTALLAAVMALCTVQGLGAKTPIKGKPEASVEQMYSFVASRNPAFDPAIAHAFNEIGRKYGIRGDIALCQAVIETGWFRFDNGTAVTADDHNYCGLGVHTRGIKGCTFADCRQGVTAMIQHLYAYACRDKLPRGEKQVDPRFGYVTRGSAPSWEGLSGRWAMNKNYGRNILDLYKLMLGYDAAGTRLPRVEQVEVTLPASMWHIDHGPDTTARTGPTVHFD